MGGQAIRNAFDALQAFGTTVAGISKSYGLTDVPEKIGREVLPCLVVVEPGEDAIQLSALTMMGGAFQVGVEIDQLLLYDLREKPLAQVFQGAFDMLDTYLQTLKNNPFLTGAATPAFHGQLKMTPKWGVWTYADTAYWGFGFKYHMVLNL